MKIEISQDSFVSGEFAPALFGRTDIAQYSNACALLENFLIRPYGPIISTPGTEFINDAKYDTVFGGNDENTLLLLHFNGTDGTTTFTDSSTGGVDSPHTMTPTNSTQIDTAQSVFGGASGLFNGTTDYLTTPDSDDWVTGRNDFTVDLRVRFAVLPVAITPYQTFFSIGDAIDTGGSGNFYFGIFWNNGVGKFNLYFVYRSQESGRVEVIKEWITPVINTWYHVAVVRNGADLKFFVDGVQISTTYNIGTELIVDSGTILYIGAYKNTFTALAGFMNGWMDELRFSNVARWTSNFTVPTNEYASEGTGDGIASRIYGKARLIPFIFSRSDAYVIEVGESYLRFYTNGGVVTV